MSQNLQIHRTDYASANHDFSPAVSLLAFSSSFALCWLLAGLISAQSITQFFAESGPVETASVMFLVFTTGVLCGNMVRIHDLGHWYLVVLVVAAALRELDWDKVFTDRGVLSLGLYSGEAPVLQKVIGLAVISMLVFATLRMLLRNLGGWLAALRSRELWPYLVAGTIGLTVMAKTLDGLARKLGGFGIEISADVSQTASRLEETLELVAVIMLLQAAGLFVIREIRQDS
jgi:hypothetical protein